jgi:hypothetical protein
MSDETNITFKAERSQNPGSNTILQNNIIGQTATLHF